MRLLVKTSLLIITVSIFIFMVWNIVFFQHARNMIMKQVDAELNTFMHHVMQSLNSSQNTPHSIKILDFVEIEHVNNDVRKIPALRDTLIFDKFQKKYIPHRILSFTYDNGIKNHYVSIQKSLLETDLVIEKLTLVSVILILVFILSIFIINRYIFEKVWASFFTTIKKMDNYDIKSKEELHLKEPEIVEFQKLNNVLESLVNRIRKDYDNLKELTANTSHELQTPLAIIRGKAELLIQSENITEKEMELISSIMETSDRLSKLNQSLLLIAKIENDQFIESEEFSLKEKLEKHIEGFEILIDSGEYILKKNLNEFRIKIHPLLFDVLITNLLKNALVHNIPKGGIKIELQDRKLRISNSGNPLTIDPNLIFKRFVKNSENKNSSGLGLELVKKICDYYDLSIVYSYTEGYHNFEIDFSKIIL
jgi:signal transduction histidine kinase